MWRVKEFCFFFKFKVIFIINLVILAHAFWQLVKFVKPVTQRLDSLVIIYGT